MLCVIGIFTQKRKFKILLQEGSVFHDNVTKAIRRDATVTGKSGR